MWTIYFLYILLLSKTDSVAGNETQTKYDGTAGLERLWVGGKVGGREVSGSKLRRSLGQPSDCKIK